MKTAVTEQHGCHGYHREMVTMATIPVVKVKPLSPIFVHDGMLSFLNWHGDLSEI